MKTFINTLVIASCLGIGGAVAQLDSPHNYKRPVIYQKQKPTAGLILQPMAGQKGVSSANNYKQQNSQSQDLGSFIAINAPNLQAPAFNPLLLPNHYKIHARPYTGTAEYAQQQPVRYQIQKPDTLGK